MRDRPMSGSVLSDAASKLDKMIASNPGNGKSGRKVPVAPTRTRTKSESDPGGGKPTSDLANLKKEDVNLFTFEVHKVDSLGFSLKHSVEAPYTLMIKNMKPDGAAATAGLCRDDFILKVDGIDVSEMSLEEGKEILKSVGNKPKIEVGRVRKALVRRRSSRRLPSSTSLRSLSRRGSRNSMGGSTSSLVGGSTTTLNTDSAKPDAQLTVSSHSPENSADLAKPAPKEEPAIASDVAGGDKGDSEAKNEKKESPVDVPGAEPDTAAPLTSEPDSTQAKPAVPAANIAATESVALASNANLVSLDPGPKAEETGVLKEAAEEKSNALDSNTNQAPGPNVDEPAAEKGGALASNASQEPGPKADESGVPKHAVLEKSDALSSMASQDPAADAPKEVGSRHARPSVEFDSAAVQNMLGQIDQTFDETLQESDTDDGPKTPREYYMKYLSDVRELIREHTSRDFAGFKREFQELQQVGTKHSTIASDRPGNKFKNKFSNIKTYDHSRVKLTLQNDDANSDYVNANYIPAYGDQLDYIACQAPTQPTFEIFWRMVWEQKTQLIVMVTDEVEGDRRKCARYWPDSDTRQPQLKYGNIIVSHNTTTNQGSFTQRHFTLQCDGESRDLQHFLFTAWPDRAMPESSATLLRMQEAVQAAVSGGEAARSGMVIHCNTGVSRTGTYIAVDRLAAAVAAQDLQLNVLKVVSELRDARTLMVQTLTQYIFVYQALADILEQSALKALEDERAQQLSLSDQNAETGSTESLVRLLEAHGDVATTTSPASSPLIERTLQELTRVSLAQWTAKEVAAWLQWLELDNPEYLSAFHQQGIDGSALLVIGEPMLARLGFHDPMDRRSFLSALHALEINTERALDDTCKDNGFRDFQGLHRLLEAEEAALMARAVSPTVIQPAQHYGFRQGTVNTSDLLKVWTDRIDPNSNYKIVNFQRNELVYNVISRILERCTMPDLYPWRCQLYEVSYAPDPNAVAEDAAGVPDSGSGKLVESRILDNDHARDLVARVNYRQGNFLLLLNCSIILVFGACPPPPPPLHVGAVTSLASICKRGD